VKSRKPRRPRRLGMLPGQFFALLHHPKDLPVVYRFKAEAESDRMPDEYLVPVYIHAVSPLDVARARGWEMQQAAKAGKVPKDSAGKPKRSRPASSHRKAEARR